MLFREAFCVTGILPDALVLIRLPPTQSGAVWPPVWVPWKAHAWPWGVIGKARGGPVKVLGGLVACPPRMVSPIEIAMGGPLWHLITKPFSKSMYVYTYIHNIYICVYIYMSSVGVCFAIMSRQAIP